MIILNNVKKSYGKGETEQTVLNGLSLEIQEGDMLSIMGPSGAGKSTFLNIIGMLDNEYEGEFLFQGVDCRMMSEKQRATMRNENIGFVFQSFHLIKDLSAIENVKMGMVISNSNKKYCEKISRKKMRQRAEEILEMLGLGNYMEKNVSQLSGGQQQRVAIARALINDPKLILADEPTGALDQKTGKDIMNVLAELNEKGRTILIVTHDKNVAGYCKMNRYMLDGKLI